MYFMIRTNMKLTLLCILRDFFLIFVIFLWRTSVLERSLIPLFWTSGDICPGFQSHGGSPCLHTLSPIGSGFLRFTSGVTPC